MYVALWPLAFIQLRENLIVSETGMPLASFGIGYAAHKRLKYSSNDTGTTPIDNIEHL